MGMTIAIDSSYMNKMPKSCKECPLTYIDTGDDAYFGANERRCVIDDSCIDGMVSERAYDCPLVEAIPKAEHEEQIKINNKLANENKQLRAYITMMQADYNARLKDDMVAMLTDLSMKIGEIEDGYAEFDEENKRSLTMIPLESVERLIDREINSLKGEGEK